MLKCRHQLAYDHRLRQLVHQTGDLSIALDLGVPRSTAAGWLRKCPPQVVSLDVLHMGTAELQQQVLRLRRRLEVMTALYRLLLALVKVLGARLQCRRLADDAQKELLLRVVQRSRSALTLSAALQVLGLSATRYHSWQREIATCNSGVASCPKASPNQLTPSEVLTIKQMVTSAEHRHVPIGRLALLAQRLGVVVASPATWYRLVRERRWRRPRRRVYPAKPKVGLRSEQPNQAWHLDTTIIKLLDGHKLYLHGVIDSFSKRILAWHLADRLQAASSARVLRDAIRSSYGCVTTPTAVVDGGSENFNSAVDDIINEGLLRRLHAQSTELRFSNSPIEAFWRSLKHQWLFLNNLDSFQTVKRLVAFFVNEHNSLPHLAFQGQTPNEMYLGSGHLIPEKLSAAKAANRKARLAFNRAVTCESCQHARPSPD